jgi:hypothetical protein
MMYLILARDEAYQMEEKPTETDFLINDAWRFFEHIDGHFAEICEYVTSMVPIAPEEQSSLRYVLYSNEGTVRQRSGVSLSDNELELLALGMLIIVKYENDRFWQLGSIDNWLPLHTVTYGDCSSGKYHLY